MSPILVRPVREQLEHDRIIRLLQAKSRRRYDPGINPGAEQNAAVGSGPAAVYPDILLFAQSKGKRLEGVIEVETGESVNHLEALAQWAHLGRLRAPFFLYVPATMVDVARQLCDDNHIHVNEIWSYHTLGDDVRFTLVQRSREALPRTRPSPRQKSRTTRAAKPAKGAKPKRRAAKPAKTRTARKRR